MSCSSFPGPVTLVLPPGARPDIAGIGAGDPEEGEGPRGEGAGGEAGRQQGRDRGGQAGQDQIPGQGQVRPEAELRGGGEEEQPPV